MKTNILMISGLLILTACGGGGGSNQATATPPTIRSVTEGPTDANYADLKAYDAAGTYADVLKVCAGLDIDLFQDSYSCSLTDLPFIGQDSSNPSIDDIMSRVVISDDWMGERFREALAVMPDDMRLLFRSITAIVIDRDIRPAYYWGGTAAIYIDPAYLWTTNEEKATVSPQEDFRASFGDELNFVDTWRYTLNDNYAYPSYSLTGEDERTVAEMAMPLTRLFYHELAHANDFMPPQQLVGLSTNQSALASLNSAGNSRVSSRLYNDSPLLSQVMLDLAETRFQTGEASGAQMTYTAEFVGSEHANDAANHFYGYSTLREDLAMMFEATMMKRNFNIEMDIGYLDRPTVEEPGCNDYTVGWGKRNIIGTAVIKPRAQFVVSEILPELDWGGFFVNLESAKTMTPGLGWCTNLVIDSTSNAAPRLELDKSESFNGWQDLNPRIH